MVKGHTLLNILGSKTCVIEGQNFMRMMVCMKWEAPELTVTFHQQSMA